MKNIGIVNSTIIACLLLISCNTSNVLPTSSNLIPIGNYNELGYINHEGEYEINPQFQEATEFSEDLAMVRSKGYDSKYGYIGKDGLYVISPNYSEATCFSDGMAWVSQNDRIMAINTKGEIVINLPNVISAQNYTEGLAAFSTSAQNGSYWGFMDKEGNVVVNPQFEIVDFFNEGKCAVKNNQGKWGYIDKTGKIIINHQYDNATSFQDGRAIVSFGLQFGVIDKSGKFIINPQFEEMISDGDRYLVKSNGLWGWCDKKGKYIINPQFEMANPYFDNSLAPVRIGAYWGYINKDGKIQINPQFERAYVFDNNIALVYNNQSYGFINKEGKYKINPQFKSVSEDYILKHKDRKSLKKFSKIGGYYMSATYSGGY